MAEKITKRVVDQLEPGDRDTFAWDSEIRGFGVRCRKSGGKFYVVKTRVGNRQRWLTIGRHGSPWTPDTARKEALRLLGKRAEGKDPAGERDMHKNAVTVQELGKRFLDEHVATRCKPKTGKDYAYIVNDLIAPALGQHAVTDISRSDVSRLHHRLRTKQHMANRTLAVLSKMMSFAEEKGLRPDSTNPCKHVKRYKEQARERYLKPEELQRLGQVLADAERQNSENPYIIAAFRLLILTGARLSEIPTLRWEHVDLEEGVLRLPDSKTGKKQIYLNAAAVDVLRHLPRGHENPFVIIGQKPGGHMVEMQKPWQRLRKAAGLEDVRIHDLRHSFASVAAASGMGLPMIGKLLGHTQAQTTQRYAHLADDPVRTASNTVGESLTAMMSPEKPKTLKRHRERLDDSDKPPKRKRVRL